MKKHLCLLLAAVLLLGGLVGCGSTGAGEASLSGASSSGEAAVSSASAGTSESDNGTSSKGELYRYHAEPPAFPLDILETLKNLPPNSLPDSIYRYDKDAYYAGENEYGTTYIISENRSFHGIDGVVAYFGSEGGCGMDMWFRAPNITSKEFQQIVLNTEKDLGISWLFQLRGGWAF